MFHRSASVLTLTLVIIAAAAAVVAGPPNSDWRDKVDTWVLESGRSQETEFLVFLDDHADLSAAAHLPTKEAKGQYVFQTLTEVASRAQVPVLEDLLLDPDSVDQRAVEGAEILDQVLRKRSSTSARSRRWASMSAPTASTSTSSRWTRRASSRRGWTWCSTGSTS